MTTTIAQSAFASTLIANLEDKILPELQAKSNHFKMFVRTGNKKMDLLKDTGDTEDLEKAQASNLLYSKIFKSFMAAKAQVDKVANTYHSAKAAAYCEANGYQNLTKFKTYTLGEWELVVKNREITDAEGNKAGRSYESGLELHHKPSRPSEEPQEATEVDESTLTDLF
jgi:hypothetical protein